MDISTLVISVNKISLFAFLITLVFLGYELYLIRQDRQRRVKPKIPEFKEKNISNRKQTQVVINKRKTFFKKPSNLLIGLLIILLVVFGLVSLLGLKASSSQEKEYSVEPTPFIRLISSKGLNVFNQKWKGLTIKEFQNLKSGDKIILGIDKSEVKDIDMARIRVNKNYWTKKDMTSKYKKEFNVFYLEYTISSQESSLKIEAQLHSKSDGWLGK